jgi:hypothetical protein
MRMPVSLGHGVASRRPAANLRAHAAIMLHGCLFLTNDAFRLGLAASGKPGCSLSPPMLSIFAPSAVQESRELALVARHRGNDVFVRSDASICEFANQLSSFPGELLA